MENKKLGILFLIISLVFLGFLFYFNQGLIGQYKSLGCEVNSECAQIENSISVSHIGFGFFGFMFALGFYILFFYKSEEMILKRLEEHKKQRSDEEKFKLILRGLDDYEKKVLREVKRQDGITQNILRLRTEMSKAKLSYVLQELEKKKLVKRSKKGRTLQVFLRV